MWVWLQDPTRLCVCVCVCVCVIAQLNACIVGSQHVLPRDEVQWLLQFAAAHVSGAQHNYVAAVKMFTDLSAAVSGHPLCEVQVRCLPLRCELCLCALTPLAIS